MQRHVGDAVERGGEVLLGGEGLGGLFFQPTVITGVTADAAMSCEETFGPIAGIARFTTEAEAVRDANDTPYGLAAYYYTRDNARIWRLSEALEYGIHGINTGLISSEVVPFGGVKESGIGREGSKYGIEEWLEIKYLCMRLARSSCRASSRSTLLAPQRRGNITWGDTVIVEQRDYHVITGKLPELVKLYETEGIELQQSYLGNLLGAYTTDIGALSTYTTLWGYENFAEREARRAKLQADDAWKAFLAKIQPLIHTQQNRILVPTSFSPVR